MACSSSSVHNSSESKSSRSRFFSSVVSFGSSWSIWSKLIYQFSSVFQKYQVRLLTSHSPVRPRRRDGCSPHKKSYEHTGRGTAERYAMIEELSVQFAVKDCCVALKVSRSGYYRWVRTEQSVQSRAPMQSYKRRVWPPTGSPPPRAGPCRCKPNAKNPRGFGGQSHPIPSITNQTNRELRVHFCGGSTVSLYPKTSDGIRSSRCM
jgi:hypothetical protein